MFSVENVFGVRGWRGVLLALGLALPVAAEEPLPTIETAEDTPSLSAEEIFEAALEAPAPAASTPPAAIDFAPIPEPLEPEPPPEPISAVAVLHDSKGSAITGTVEFRHAGDAIAVRAELGGLVPGATYRLQIHEYGDCRAMRARSAGDVFGASDRLAVFQAGEDGWVDLTFSHRGHVLDRSVDSMLGRSIVIHGGMQREGCGTIGIARRKVKPATEPVPASLD